MEFKGTKGNWIASEDTHNFSVNRKEDFQDGRRLHIDIRIYDIPVVDVSKSDENKANALLISKAPELLEMLEMVYTLLNPVTDDSGVKESYYQLMPKIEQLLKEATEI